MSAFEKFQKLLRERRQIHNDFNYVFGTPEGKRVLAYICKIGYVNTSTFSLVSRDKTLLNEGSRLLALAILKHTHKQPEEAVTESITDTNTSL